MPAVCGEQCECAFGIAGAQRGDEFAVFVADVLQIAVIVDADAAEQEQLHL